jgi:hypothetical protein
MHVLDIGGHDPQEPLGLGNLFQNDPAIDLFVEEEFGHEEESW